MQPRPMSSGKPGMLDPAISTSEAPFSCIADETALVTSMKGDGRADVRKWVVDGLVTLCIPLHTLDQLDGLRSQPAVKEYAQETLVWLDEATSQSGPDVRLQGTEEAYENWTDVEKFILPGGLHAAETPKVDGINRLTTQLNAKLHVQDQSPSDINSATSSCSFDVHESRSSSPESAFSACATGTANPSKPKTSVKSNGTGFTSPTPTNDWAECIVPTSLKPLFNHVLWAIHEGYGKNKSPGRFFLLTNDDRKVATARYFGITCKNTSELAAMIAKELPRRDRVKTATTTPPMLPTEEDLESPEDEIVLKRASPVASPRVPSVRATQRGTSPRGQHSPKWRGRNGGRNRRRGGATPSRDSTTVRSVELPIDPDSFVRSSLPLAPIDRSAGRRRLWEPV